MIYFCWCEEVMTCCHVFAIYCNVLWFRADTFSALTESWRSKSIAFVHVWSNCARHHVCSTETRPPVVVIQMKKELRLRGHAPAFWDLEGALMANGYDAIVHPKQFSFFCGTKWIYMFDSRFMDGRAPRGWQVRGHARATRRQARVEHLLVRWLRWLSAPLAISTRTLY